jgi:hypothetical protein
MVGAQIKVSDLNERRRCRKGFAVKNPGSSFSIRHSILFDDLPAGGAQGAPAE